MGLEVGKVGWGGGRTGRRWWLLCSANFHYVPGSTHKCWHNHGVGGRGQEQRGGEGWRLE